MKEQKNEVMQAILNNQKEQIRLLKIIVTEIDDLKELQFPNTKNTEEIDYE
jgi:hypothetical protein